MKFIKCLWAMVFLLGLISCGMDQSNLNEAPPPAGINGTEDSNVLMLELGMSKGRVDSIIGPSEFEKRSGSFFNSITCTSHVYNEEFDVKFVHTYFKNGSLIAASDSHSTTCQ
jgi:hypothetical protein